MNVFFSLSFGLFLLSSSAVFAQVPAACGTVPAGSTPLYVCTLDSSSDQSKAPNKVTSATLCLIQQAASGSNSASLQTNVVINGASAVPAPYGYFSGNAIFTAQDANNQYVLNDYPENIVGYFDYAQQQFDVVLDRTKNYLTFLQTSDGPWIWQYKCLTDHCDGTEPHDFSIKPVVYSFGMNCQAVQ